MYYGLGDENSTAAEELRRQELAQEIMDAAGEDDSEKMESLIAELNQVKASIAEKQARKAQAEQVDGSMEEILQTIEGLKNAPAEYDDLVTRQLIDCIRVVKINEIQITFKDGKVIQKRLRNRDG